MDVGNGKEQQTFAALDQANLLSTKVEFDSSVRWIRPISVRSPALIPEPPGPPFVQ